MCFGPIGSIFLPWMWSSIFRLTFLGRRYSPDLSPQMFSNILNIHIGPKTGPIGPENSKNCTQNCKVDFFTKTVFWQFQMEFGRSRGVRGHCMDHTKRSPRTLAVSGRIFMFCGNIGNSLHHQIHWNWSWASRLVFRFLFKAKAPSQELWNHLFSKKWHPETHKNVGTLETSKNMIFW